MAYVVITSLSRNFVSWDTVRLWCEHFTSRSLVSQNDIHVTSDEKNCSQDTPETGTERQALP